MALSTNIRSAAIATLWASTALLIVVVDAQAACSQNGSTWECTGFIRRQGIWQNGLYTAPTNAGIQVYSGDIDIHVLAGGTVSTSGSGMAAGSDAISNNYFGMAPGDVHSLHVLNDGQIVAADRGGSNFAVELSLAPANLLGPVTFDNNGLIQGVQAGFSVNSSGLFTLNNSSSGIVRANLIGLNIGAPGSRIDNLGTIEVVDTANGYAIGGTEGTDTVSLRDGTIVGNVILRGGDDVFNWYGGSLKGNVLLGDGSDKVLVATPTFDSNLVLDGGDDLSASDGMVDELTFKDVTTDIKGANLINWERIVVDNTNLTVLDTDMMTGTAAGEGLVVGSGGSVHVGGGFTLSGRTTLLAGGKLDLKPATTGTATFNGDVSNAGLLSASNSVAGNTIVVNGDYVGQGGEVRLDTVMADDASATDKLKINGNSAGNSYLKIVNSGGAGAQTVEGIKVIEVAGTSLGTFSLLGDYVHNGQQAVVQGAYAYKLYQGAPSSPQDGNWYLRSQLVTPNTPQFQGGVPVYEAYPRVLLELNELPTLEQRVGSRFWITRPSLVIAGEEAQSSTRADVIVTEEGGFWIRSEGNRSHLAAPISTSDMQYSVDDSRIQLGIDRVVADRDHGRLIAAVTLQHLSADADIASPHGDGSLMTTGFGVGATLTWYGDDGFYLDSQAQLNWMESDFLSHLATSKLADGVDAHAYSVSVEAGRRLALQDGWALTPQAQLTYTSVRSNDFEDVFKSMVHIDRAESMQGRFGLALDHQKVWQDDAGETRRLKIYGIANLYYQFLDDTSVIVSDTDLHNGIDRVSGGLGIGASYNWGNDKYSLYAEASAKASLINPVDSYSYKATAGIRIKW